MLGQVSNDPFGLFDVPGVVDQVFDFTERMLEVNRKYVKNLADASANVRTAMRENVGSFGTAIRQQAEETAAVTHEQAEKVEQAERQQARQARRIARQEAAEKYDGLTKAELQDKLAERDLPKTGNV